MIRLQRQANRQRGCLLGILWTLLFGVFYWSWLAIKWTVKASVAVLRLSWRWTWALCVWTWRGSVALWRLTYAAIRRGMPFVAAGVRKATPWVQERTRAFSTRYGAKGWYIIGGSVGAVLIVLIALGALTSH